MKILKNARFETSATNDASTVLQILPSQKPETKLMDIVFSRRRRVEAGAFSDLKNLTTFTKTHSSSDFPFHFLLYGFLLLLSLLVARSALYVETGKTKPCKSCSSSSAPAESNHFLRGGSEGRDRPSAHW